MGSLELVLCSILGLIVLSAFAIGNESAESFATSQNDTTTQQTNTSNVGTMEITITHPNGTELMTVQSALDCGHIKLGGPGRGCILD